MTSQNSETKPIIIDRLTAQTAQDILKVRSIKVGASDKAKEVGVEPLEKLATDGLGVLQEQGVYAFILYNFYKSGSKTTPEEIKAEELGACFILANFLKLMKDLKIEFDYKVNGLPKTLVVEFANPINLNKQVQKQAVLDYFADHISGDLNRLLLVKNAFTQTLTYLRYGAKAFKETKTA